MTAGEVLTIIGHQDGVFLQLGDGHDVHELVSGDHGLRPVLVLQLVRVEPGAAGVEVDHVQLQRSAVVSSPHVHTNCTAELTPDLAQTDWKTYQWDTPGPE